MPQRHPASSLRKKRLLRERSPHPETPSSEAIPLPTEATRLAAEEKLLYESEKDEGLRVAFEAKLGYAFRKPLLFWQAMRHRSFCHEKNLSPLLSYERLEFLGDSVLQLAISSDLFSRFPATPEGELTALRASLVCRPSLVGIAQALGIGAILRLGRGEDRLGGRERPSTLADAFEALLGAICLDHSFDEARRICLSAFAETLEGLSLSHLQNFKSRLQETLARHALPAPLYRFVSCTGPGNQQTFVMEVALGDSLSAQGSGPSKKMASQDAAHLLLEKLDALLLQPDSLDSLRQALRPTPSPEASLASSEPNDDLSETSSFPLQGGPCHDIAS